MRLVGQAGIGCDEPGRAAQHAGRSDAAPDQRSAGTVHATVQPAIVIDAAAVDAGPVGTAAVDL
jgi:hypothetical protein